MTSSARTAFGPSAFARRRRRHLDVPPSLRGALAPGATLDIETEQADDGTVEVVDCEIIASRRELRRWRLSLTDFHALIAGGTGSIEAYRQAQRRRDEALAQAAQRAQELAATAVAEAPQLGAAPPAAPTGAALPQADRPEPLWRKVVAWPYRALKRLVGALLRLIG